MFTDNICRVDMDSEFDETECGFDNLSIRGVKENHNRGEDFVGHLPGNVVWKSKSVGG